ncbi:MAG TPA: hypothetical protein VMT00_05515 [Thermoanaerobaculia bacterium]|nr:hypothetical protein [Thermoanaerobaculia bacterium]
MPDKFRFTHPTNPGDYTDYERLPDGTFRMVFRSLSPRDPPSNPWHRC